MGGSRVIVIGSLNYDVFLEVQRLPQIGETYAAQGMQVSGGGKGANQAVQCAKLGLTTLMVGAVGNDPMGDFLLKGLARYRVDTAFVRREAENTGFAAVHRFEDGRVCATIVPGANGLVTCGDVDRVAPLMEGALAVVLQLEIPVDVVEYAIEIASQRGVKVLLNTAPAAMVSDGALMRCDTVMANEVEAAFYTGRKIQTVEDALEAIVPFAWRYNLRAVFTLGEKGAVVCDGGTPVHIPPVPAQVVETTGAGDSFVGGYLKGLEAGLDFLDAVRFAARCSAVTISKVGGQAAMPNLSQVEGFLAKN